MNEEHANIDHFDAENSIFACTCYGTSFATKDDEKVDCIEDTL